MKTVSRNLSAMYRSTCFPFLALTFFMLGYHLLIPVSRGDDAKFRLILQNHDLLSWLCERYSGWSSRVLIEAVLVTLLYISGWLWKLLNVMMIGLFVFSLSYLFVKREKRTANWLIVCLFLLIPAPAFHSAGWASTTLNYLWPMTLGLIALFPLKKILLKQQLKKYESFLYACALIFAANQEQLCVSLLIIYGGFLIYFIFYRRLPFFILSQFLIAAASFLFIMNAPGNHARLMVQVEKYNHHFFMLPMINKIEIGAFSSTLNHFIFQFDPIFVLLSFVVMAATYARYQELFLRTISTVPLFCVLMFGMMHPMTSALYPRIRKSLIDVDVIPYGYIHLENVWSLESYLPIAVLGLTVLCLMLALLYLFNGRRILILIYLVLLAGFMSRMVIGFTPSAWGSGVRAFFFLYVSLMIIIILVYQELLRLKPAPFNPMLLTVTGLFAGLAFLNGYILGG
ncbi:DUF6056 family protein [Sporolactobacillus sp. Y61]|uniref:DUF6056 family protein n=1 Tax=Sporolactobacillus sp. Y61 TaxID=3160863 RepID=A0AAU8II61_9BACL